MIIIGFVAMAALGTLARWQLGLHLPRPAGTLVANLAGAFALGWLSGSAQVTHTVVGVAALGSLTTFSTLMLELVEMWARRRTSALSYLAITMIGGVGLAWLGLSIA